MAGPLFATALTARAESSARTRANRQSGGSAWRLGRVGFLSPYVPPKSEAAYSLLSSADSCGHALRHSCIKLRLWGRRKKSNKPLFLGHQRLIVRPHEHEQTYHVAPKPDFRIAFACSPTTKPPLSVPSRRDRSEENCFAPRLR